MNKHSLNRFIDKYYLGGNCSSVVINSKGDKLSTRFITGDKNLLGELHMTGWNFDEADLGVYNTEQLVKLLSVLSENITMNLTKAGDKAVSLKISDSNSDVNYMLSDLSVISSPPNLKSIPDFEVKIKVDKSFMQKFIAGKGALADTDNFTVLTNDDELMRIATSFRDWGRDCWCASGCDNTCLKRFEWQLGELPEGYDHKYTYSHLGYNLKSGDIQAAIGLALLERLDAFIEARRSNWKYLHEGLRDLQDSFVLPTPTVNSDPSWFGFALLFFFLMIRRPPRSTRL